VKPASTGRISFIEISGSEEDNVTFEGLMCFLPKHLQAAIARKKFRRRRLLQAAGWLSLRYQLIKNGCDAKLMAGIQTTDFGKPFIPGTFKFSISYSGNFAVCAVSTVNQLGVDIEIIKDINYPEFSKYFNDAEWSRIIYSEDPQRSFFHYWTRKESVLKADGRGLYVDLRDVMVDETTGRINDSSIQYYLSSLPDLGDNVAVTLCTDQPEVLLAVERINVADL
jgi:4'-phosphopantetheinyl transferase